MSDREILLRSLASVAARLGWSRRMPELGRLVCALVALWLVGEVLRAFGVSGAVLSALTPAFVLGALAVVALFAWRLTRPVTLAQAAGAADTRAGLNDELRSAHWFLQQPARDALVELLLNRAARTAQRLEARRLFPLRVPRSILGALALAALSTALAWFSPRIALPGMQEAASSAVAGPTAGNVAAAEGKAEKTAAAASPKEAARQEQRAAWSQLEQMAKQLPPGADNDTIKRALGARDAQLLEQLLQGLLRKHAAAADGSASISQQPGKVARSLLEHLQALLDKDAEDAAREPTGGASTQASARITQQVRQQAEEESRKMTGSPAQGEVEFNPRLRAVTRSGVSMREVAYATGEVAEAGANTSVDGPAMGPPDGKGQAGGTSGEHPHSSPSNATDTDPVLGEPTVRLQTQLDLVHVERDADPQQQATKEEFYVATQRRASQIDYENVAAQWHAQREAILPASRTPVSYREAVKRYFLIQHAKEE